MNLMKEVKVNATQKLEKMRYDSIKYAVYKENF